MLAPGRYQTEAAIQSLHVARRRGHPVAPDTLLTLYDALWAFAPTIGVAVNRAAVMAQAGQLLDALAHIDELPSDVVRTYQPWWALRAHVLTLLGRRDEAAVAYDTASGLTESPSVRAFLLARRAALSVGTQ